MAELDIILSASEEANMLKLVFDQEGWLVPDIDYSEPRYSTIESYQAYLDYRKQTRLFFILHSSYLKSPLELRRIEKNGHTVYYVMQRNGGPTIDFLSSVEFEEEGKTFISTGSLSYYPTYWNTIAHSNMRAPEAQKEFFKQLVAEIKKSTIKTKLGVRTYWIGRATSQAIKNGEKFLGIVSAPA